MELAQFFRGLETMGVEVPSFLPYLIVAIFVAVAAVSFRANRRNARAAARNTTSDLGARLAEIDPADYDFEGNKKAEQEPKVNFDDFFSNASRREELQGAERATDQRL